MKNIIALIVFSLCLSSCHIYSFTGASIDPSVKTVHIQNFPNNASLVVPSLSQKLNLQLKNKFVNSTNLSITDNNDADLNFTGEITSYTILPIAAQAETAALSRLTITVNIEFTNKKDEKQNWTSSFTKYSDFESNKEVSTVQEALIDDITEQLADAIFNKAVVNW